MKKSVAVLLALATLSIPFAASAQAGNDYQCRNAARGEVSNHQEFCFTDTAVRGDRDLALGTGVRPGWRPTGISLLRYRENFVNQMLRTVENF